MRMPQFCEDPQLSPALPMLVCRLRGGAQLRIGLFESPTVISELRQFLEGIEYFQARTLEVFGIAGGNGQTVAAGGGGNVTVFHGHALPVLFKQNLLISPDMRDADVEAKDPPTQRLHQPLQPRLQFFTLETLLRAHPIGELGDYNGTGEAAFLFPCEPGDYLPIAKALGWLADDISV